MKKGVCKLYVKKSLKLWKLFLFLKFPVVHLRHYEKQNIDKCC